MNFAELLSIAQQNNHAAQTQLKNSRAPVTEYNTPGKELKLKPDLNLVKARLAAHHQKLKIAERVNQKSSPNASGSSNEVHNFKADATRNSLHVKSIPSINQNPSLGSNKSTNTTKNDRVSGKSVQPSKAPSSTNSSTSKEFTSGACHLQNKKVGGTKPVMQAKTPQTIPAVKKSKPIPLPPAYSDLLRLATTVQNEPDAEITFSKRKADAPRSFGNRRLDDSFPSKRPSHPVISHPKSKDFSKPSFLDKRDRGSKSLSVRPISSVSVPPLKPSSSQMPLVSTGRKVQNSEPKQSNLRFSEARTSKNSSGKNDVPKKLPSVNHQFQKPSGILKPARNRRPVGISRSGISKKPICSSSGTSSVLNNKTVVQKTNSIPKPVPALKPTLQSWQNPYSRKNPVQSNYPPYRPPMKKRPLPDDNFDDDYDSDMADFIDDGEVEEDVEDISKTIQDIFGYDRSRYVHRDREELPTETRVHEQWREEARSLQIGKLEDEREEERERQELLRKKKLKR